MKLTARIAASSLRRRAAGAGTRRSAAAWPRLALRWRRRVHPSVVPGVRPSASFVSQVWSPRFHLHFGISVTTIGSTRVPAAPAPSTARIVPLPARDVSRSSRTAQRDPKHRTHPGASPRGSVARHAPRLAPARTASAAAWPEATNRHHVEQIVSRSVTRHSYRAVALAQRHRAPVDLRAMPQPPVRSTPMRPSAPIHANRPVRRERKVEAPAQRAARRTAAALFESGLELSWRTRNSTGPIASSAALAGPGVSTPVSPGKPPSARAVPAPEPSAPLGNAAARGMALDSAMVDRLAEDVIRRVERHVRIERERRGV